MRLIGLVVLALEFTLAPLAAQAHPPSDAELIAHFEAHREEFEALVALYQAHGHILSSHPEYQKHAGVIETCRDSSSEREQRHLAARAVLNGDGREGPRHEPLSFVCSS